AGGYRGAFRNAEDYDLWLRLAAGADLANVPRPLLRYRFSVDGMTLGRKWEQVRFVCLAQASNLVRRPEAMSADALADERVRLNASIRPGVSSLRGSGLRELPKSTPM